MKKTDLFLMIRPDTRVPPQAVPWTGYTSKTPGLVVCRAPRYEGGEWKPSRYWQVIHQGSGFVLPYCRDLSLRKVALTTASLLGVFVNWTQTKEEIHEQCRSRIRPQDIIRTVERAEREVL